MTSKRLLLLGTILLLAGCDANAGSQKPVIGPLPTGAIIPPVDPAYEPPTLGKGVPDTVTFEMDSAALGPEAQATLQKQTAWLAQNPQVGVVRIEGHADERGTREYNLALGARRAQAVADYLSAVGVDPARLQQISYGKERPVCPESTDTCWARNRRAVTTLGN